MCFRTLCPHPFTTSLHSYAWWITKVLGLRFITWSKRSWVKLMNGNINNHSHTAVACRFQCFFCTFARSGWLLLFLRVVFKSSHSGRSLTAPHQDFTPLVSGGRGVWEMSADVPPILPPSPANCRNNSYSPAHSPRPLLLRTARRLSVDGSHLDHLCDKG